MKHKWLVGLVLLAGTVGAAQARTNVSIAVGVPLGVVAYDHYYYAPPPPPPPPPVYYRERVYYEPRPVYYAPTRISVGHYHGRSDHRYCNHGGRHRHDYHDGRRNHRDGWVDRGRRYRDN